MVTNIFDRMAAERARVLVQRKDAVGWKLNDAALKALRHEGAIDAARPVEELLLFGLPVLLDRDDQSQEHRFSLLTVVPK